MTPAATVFGGAEASPMGEQSSSRPPPADIRSILEMITEAVMEDADTKQKFREDTNLFVLLGQVHGFVNENEFDEAYDRLVTLQALLG